jgi:hypothetical protein
MGERRENSGINFEARGLSLNLAGLGIAVPIWLELCNGEETPSQIHPPAWAIPAPPARGVVRFACGISRLGVYR